MALAASSRNVSFLGVLEIETENIYNKQVGGIEWLVSGLIIWAMKIIVNALLRIVKVGGNVVQAYYSTAQKAVCQVVFSLLKQKKQAIWM